MTLEELAQELVARSQVAASILTHNGKFTVHNPATGEHRTYRVRTQDVDAKFAPGKRVVGMLTGADNERDYTNFGFVDELGVSCWEKQKGRFQKHADMLSDLARLQAEGKVIVYAETRCRVCNRTLTTPESVRSGIGPICDGRV